MFTTFRNTALAAVAALATATALNSAHAGPLTYTYDAKIRFTFGDRVTANLTGTFTINPPGDSLSSGNIVVTGGQEAGTYHPGVNENGITRWRMKVSVRRHFKHLLHTEPKLGPPASPIKRRHLEQR